MNAEYVQPASSALAYGSPGAAIRAARVRAGLSLEELASRTRLARPTLEAMENDAFELLLEPVYVRGYYRKCARILEIPDQPLIEAYEALYAPPPKLAPARLRLASGGDLGSAPRFAGRLAILAPIAAVVLCVLIWLWRQSATPPAPPQTITMMEPSIAEGGVSDTMPPIDPPASPIAGEPVPVEAPVAAVGDAAAVAVLVPAETLDPAQAEAAAAAGATPAAAMPAPAGSQLVLEFKAISWARVEDAAGKSLASGVISAGERLQLEGQPPYAIFLGNAPGVTVQFGGQPFDVKPYTKGNSTARFSVPAAGG